MTDADFQSGHAQSEGTSTRRPVIHTSRDEQRLLEYLDDHLPAWESGALEAHLASCAQCQALAEKWRLLDAQLEAHFRLPSLSPGFARRVWTAIENAGSLAGLPAYRPKPLEAEWAAAWAQHRRRFLWTQLPGALDKVGFALGASLLILVLLRVAIMFLNLVPSIFETSFQPWIMPVGISLTAASLLGVLGFTAKRPLARLLATL
jgi:hypothetical protein